MNSRRQAGAAVLVALFVAAGCAKPAPESKTGATPTAAAGAGERKVLYWYDPMAPG